LFLHLFICVYIVWTKSTPSPSHLPLPSIFPYSQAEPVLPSCSPVFLKRKHKI
jgi:hypothetical protein